MELRSKPGGALRNRYERIRSLGQGGAGAVWEAFDRERGRRVALKALHQTDGEAIYRLKREFRQLAELDHPNIAELYDLVFEGGEWFYTMELVSGVPFVQFCTGTEPGRRAPRVDHERLRGALRGLAEGLTALHASGKVHRDVKPSNVLVTGAGRVVLLDFSLVSEIAAHDETVSAVVGGTARYMAPEQMDLGETPTPACDWYAVGVMLFEVLTGATPFSGSPAEIAQAKRKLEPPPLPRHEGIDEALCELCQALLRREPGLRATGSDVLAVAAGAEVDHDRGTVVRALPAERRPFIGREGELGVLEGCARTAGSSRMARVVRRLSSPISAAVTQGLDAERVLLEQTDATPAALTNAINAYDGAGMALHAAAWRYARGKVVGGDRGKEDTQRAVERFRKEGVVCPEKLLATLVPSTVALG